MTQTMTPATAKQVAYLQSLAAKRVVPTNVLADIDAAEAGLLSVAGASHLIDLLKGMPFNGAAFRRSAPASAPAPARNVPAGLYTVTDGSGHVTLKVETNASWANGQTVISYLNGSNNERSYKGFAFATESGVKVWKAFRENSRLTAAAQFLMTGDLNEARQEFLNLAEAHALQSGNCLACLKTLTVPASLHRGLGPVCAQRLGVA